MKIYVRPHLHYRVGPKKFFSALVVRAMIEEDIAYRILHADTTARLVYGEYRAPPFKRYD